MRRACPQVRTIPWCTPLRSNTPISKALQTWLGENTCIFAGLLVVYGVCIYPLLAPGALVGHDAVFHCARIGSLAECIQNASLYPAMLPQAHSGFGYALGVFYANFFIWPFALITALGVPVGAAYKLYQLVVWAELICVSYVCGKKLLKNSAAALCMTALYAGSAYVALDFYERAAMGEAQALVFLPLVLLGAARSVWGERRRNVPLVLGFAGLALSHNIGLALTAAGYAAFLLLHTKTLVKEPKRLLSIAACAGVTLLLTAFYLLPLAEQTLRAEVYAQSEAALARPLEYARLRSLFFYTRSYQTDWTQPDAPYLGATLLAVLLARCAFGFHLPQTQLEKLRDSCLVCGALCVLCATSLFPWGAVPALAALQFTWRLFFVAAGFLSVAGGAMVAQTLENRPSLRRWLPVAVVLVCCVQFAAATLAPLTQIRRADMTQEMDGAPAQRLDTLYLDASTDWQMWQQRKEYAFTVTGYDAPVSEAAWTWEENAPYGTRLITFSGNTTQNSLQCAVAYFLGYTAIDTATGETLATRASDIGWLVIDIGTRREGTIRLVYTGTPIARAAPWVSLFTAAGLALAFFVEKSKKYLK